MTQEKILQMKLTAARKEVKFYRRMFKKSLDEIEELKKLQVMKQLDENGGES